ncbi:MAG TPA: type II toxin-antitoxin system VapC family toxin [Pirellulales bacterium]|jgi:PIN domain nuclease of toxin-antitoxin system|nr:type II toxin-antitoxin system VapC family toxin [Pirellulales bacterium]
MKLILDTHVFLWMSLDDPRLSRQARDLIADSDNELLLSPASYWELAIKVSLGKYQLAEPLDEFVNREVEINGVTILPIQPTHAAQVAGLPFHHRDPFDRLLVA